MCYCRMCSVVCQDIPERRPTRAQVNVTGILEFLFASCVRDSFHYHIVIECVKARCVVVVTGHS
jgi:hypothetical protein